MALYISFISFFDGDDMFEGRGVPEARKARGGTWGVAVAGSLAPWDGAAMSQRVDVLRVARALGP
jgi:hypothetical protein